ncbi:translocation/assembly module TamB domain-containing protein [Sphingorhabdus arenilitoris]|uniref:Translocation/assembly module TamB domain-containing protein n=1 Tax=Sphingorhabdus arenilitoris TaxID=1490041 RepID=A0ABV8RCT8_9SPHN
MTDDSTNEYNDTVKVTRWSWPKRIFASLSAALLVVIVAAFSGYIWLDSKSGHRFIIGQIEAMTFENGMKVKAGRLDGSIYDQLEIHDLTIADPKGDFASVPHAQLDWSPFALLSNHVDINSLTAKRVNMLRLPEFKEVPDSDDPLLPDIDIDIARLTIDQIDIAEAVTGKRHLARFSGSAKIADRRAQIRIDAAASEDSGMAGGDMLKLVLDAVPDDNIFDVDARLTAPADGLLAGLSGVAKPLDITLSGKGDWAKWEGQLTGLSGGDKWADLALTGRESRFTASGNFAVGPFLEGQAAQLFAPLTYIDMRADLDDRRAQIYGGIASANFDAGTNGIVDFGDNSFDDLAVFIRLKRPAALAANMSGENIRLRALLNDQWARPLVAYNLQAGRLAFDETAILGLIASGESRINRDRTIIPVTARADRIAGLNEAAGELLTGVRLSGNLAYANNRILSDDLKITSRRIDATAIVAADLNSGRYTAALNGRVNDYRIESVGIFNIETDVDVETQVTGFALTGTVKARSTRIFNDGAREFLGGNSFVTANVRYGTDGVIRIASARLAAPSFRLTQGSGSYTPSGGLDFAASGNSAQYGPLGLRLTGSVAAPVARIAAPRPGFGIGMANVVATVRGSQRGYDVIAAGDTSYGPFSADVGILAGGGPLTVDIGRADFAGIAVSGRINQTPAGPFAGQLIGAGQGFDGTITLSSYQNSQRLIIDAAGNNMRLSGPAQLTAGRAIADADIILFDKPQIIADVQLSNATINSAQIALARAKINYRGESGTAQIFAEGRSGAPFRMAINADLAPELWRVAAKGRVNGLDIATATPLRIIPRSNEYQILPATINVANGKVQLAGSYGDAIDIESRLTGVNLAALNPMFPALGIGGTATGSLDWYQASSRAFPQADARLQLNDFTRTSLASQSLPVDINLVGRLLPDGGNARLVIRRRGAAVGRMQVDLRPLPPGAGPWVDRLMQAPLSGGIRYNGPADALFSLAALPDQNLAGNIGVAADFSGRVASPQLSGVVRANDLIYENAAYGTRLTQLRLRGRFTNDQLQVSELTAKAGKGSVSGSGFVSLSSAQGFPVQLNLDLDNARLAQNDLIASEASGRISITNSANSPAVIRGTLRLPETRYRIVRQGSANVAKLTGVRRKPPLRNARITGDPDPIESLPSNWQLDIALVAENQLYISGMGLESEWSSDLKISGTTDAPRITGRVDLVRGTLGFAGRSFQLETGRISFNGPAVNPSVRIAATSEIEGVTTQVTIRGTGLNPDITFSSTPTLPQDEIMARILFGNSVGELNAIQAVQLAASLNSLRGGSGGLNPLGVLQASSGIDRLRILGADQENGRGTSVAFGQYITNDVYVEIVTDARGYTASQIEISLTPALSVLSQFSSFGSSNVNVRYRKDY